MMLEVIVELTPTDIHWEYYRGHVDETRSGADVI